MRPEFDRGIEIIFEDFRGRRKDFSRKGMLYRSMNLMQ